MTKPENSQRPCSFLHLPPEVRNQILGHLLLRRPYIECSYRTHDLHPQILRSNQQLYHEGLDVLYGRNYFYMRIWSKYDEPRVPFALGDFLEHHGHYETQWQQLHRIQHYDIYVELQSDDEYFVIKSAVRRVAAQLSEMSSLKHLRIVLGEHVSYQHSPPEWLYDYSRVLQPFTLLRNVARVEVTGAIQPRYSEYLRDIMEGGSPRDHLPKMYQALEELAGPFEEFEDDLSEACEAMEEDDTKRFKELRSKLTQQVVNRTLEKLNHLLDHDADHEERQTWVIEQRRSRKRSGRAK